MSTEALTLAPVWVTRSDGQDRARVVGHGNWPGYVLVEIERTGKAEQVAYYDVLMANGKHITWAHVSGYLTIALRGDTL